MINITFDPILAAIGPFAVSWHGLWGAVAVAVAVLVGIKEGRNRGISSDDIYNIAVICVPVAIVTARLAHVVDKLGFYLSNPGYILAIQEGGLSIQGGLIGGILAGIIYCRVRGLSAWRVADVAAPAVILAQAVGRLGCLMNGDAWGGPTGLPWGVVYTHPAALIPIQLHNVSTQPYPAYEIIWDLIVFGVLWKVGFSLRPDGSRLLLWGILYSIGRFPLTMVRQEDVFMLGMQQAQFFSLLTLVVAVPWLLIRMRQYRRQEEQAQRSPVG
ncbi:MAG: prolipoprotein diacylglyceryl transferase [Chloroflexi bacterium]|nr:prolipoprotein diacylglyceryl transferase [Chloroflexota bacterium]